MKVALIAGATGLVGRYCLEALLQSPHYSAVMVLVRKPIEAAPHPKLKTKIVDFDRLDQSLGDFSADDIYCCLGTTIKKAGTQEAFRKVDHNYVIDLAQATRSRGASQFMVVSAMGADPHSKIFYNRTKGEMEEALKTVPFTGLHIFRPSLLTGPREEFRLGERLADVAFHLINPILRGEMKKYRSIEAATVGRAMVQAAVADGWGTHLYESDKIQELGNSARA